MDSIPEYISDSRGPNSGLTPEDLVDLPVPAHPRISPSGKYVVYQTAPLGRAGKHTKTTLWIARTEQADSARQLTSGLFNDRAPEWCPMRGQVGSEAVAFLSDRGREGESCGIWLMDIDGRNAEPRPLTEPCNEQEIISFRWSPNGQGIAYVSADEESEERKARKEAGDDAHVHTRWDEDARPRRLRITDVSTREVYNVFDFDWGSVWGCNWSFDSSQLLFTTSETPDLNSPLDGMCLYRAWLMSSVKDDLELICKVLGRIHDAFYETAEGHVHFLAGATPDSTQTAVMMYQISSYTGEWRGIAYGEKNDAIDVQQLVNGFVIKVLEGPRNFLHWYQTYENPQILHESTQEITDWHVSKSQGLQVVFCTSGYGNAMEVYTKTGDKHATPLQLSSHARHVQSRFRGKHEYAYIEAAADDDTSVDGFFVRPDQHLIRGPSFPTLVFIHGGPYMHSINSFDSTLFRWGPWLLQNGCGLLYPNYRGGSGKGETFAGRVRGRTGIEDYSDVITFVEEAISRGLVDENRLVIGGWSQGGFMSYLAAVRNAKDIYPRSRGWQFQGAICGAGITDQDMLMMTSDMPTAQIELCGHYPGSKGDRDVKCRDASAIWALKDGIDNFPKMLMLHGEADVRVPLSQALAFHRACRQYKELREDPDKFPELVTYPGEPHLMEGRAHLIDMLHRVSAFMKQWSGWGI